MAPQVLEHLGTRPTEKGSHCGRIKFSARPCAIPGGATLPLPGCRRDGARPCLEGAEPGGAWPYRWPGDPDQVRQAALCPHESPVPDEPMTRPLFEHDDPKEGRLTQTMMETLAEMERERVLLMEGLARLAEWQKGLQKEMRAIERRHRDIARNLEEYTVPEDRELTHEDVNLWCRSAYFNLAHTAPQNPHAYFSRKKVREPRMYERVVRFILDNGYSQRYGNSDYTVLDIEMNGTKWFCWAMTTNPSESQVLNLKPVTLKPGMRPWAESPDGGAT